MNPAPSSPRKAGPTLRTIAARLGISAATVSLALRRSPRISPETRDMVQRAATEIGYRPDPHIAKLMTHLRVGRKPGFKSIIHALTTCSEQNASPYLSDIIASARQRADELGYGFALQRFTPGSFNRRAVERTLHARGVEGILLLPMAAPIALDGLLDWSRFSVLSATYGVRSPEFHRVVPHQFSNMSVVCRELAALGYRRIGLVHRLRQSATVNHSFLAAVTAHIAIGASEPVSPLLFPGELPTNVDAWFKREKPDAVIIDGEHVHAAILRDLGVKSLAPLGVALTNRFPDSKLSGMNEHPHAIGRTAVEQLALRIQTGDKGMPTEPVVTMVEGRWIATRSVRQQNPERSHSRRQAAV